VPRHHAVSASLSLSPSLSPCFDEVQPEDMHTDFSDPCHDTTL
jgi:hypothetical protein